MLRSGYPFYGQNIGVLVFSTTTPRTPGDAGNAKSYTYPVCYQVVEGGFADLVEGSPEIRENLLNAVQALRERGIRAILGDCGLMSLYQTDIACESGLVTAASSLCQIPMIWELIGRRGKIGILTGHSKLLRKPHLLQSGWREDIPLVIQGLQDEPHFSEIVIDGGCHLDSERMEADVCNGAQKLIQQDGEVRAILIECSNLSTYSWRVYEKTGLPVFDLMGAANLIAHSIEPPKYLTE